MVRHFYDCAEMVPHWPQDKDYGRFTVDEYVLCDYDKHTVHTWARIRKKMQYTMTLVGAEVHEWKEGRSGQGIFHMAWDCLNNKVTSKFEEHSSEDDAIAKYYPPGIKVVSTNNTVMLLENDKLKLAMYPESYDDITLNFDTEYDNKLYTFVFNQHTNQYWLDGLCIEK